MIVWVDDTLFDGTKFDIDLLSLLRQAAQRRHTLVISDSPTGFWNGRQTHFKQWHEHSLTPKLQREVSFLIQRLRMVSSNLTTRGKAKPIWVSERTFASIDVCQLNLIQAIRALALPLHILVENQINDAAFLRIVMPPAWRDKLQLWERNGELRFVQGGGISEMKRILEFHRNDSQSESAFGLPSRVWTMTHFLIYDHDGKSKDVVGEGARELEKEIRKTFVPSHRLTRRAQENYIPKSCLLEIIAMSGNSEEEKNFLDDAVKCHWMFQPNSQSRHYSELPRLGKNPYFKNEFANPKNASVWDSIKFEEDGIWPEMTLLAETIAAAI